MADEEFDPVSAGAVAIEEPPPEQFDPTQFGAVPVQQEEPGILQKAGKAVVQAVGKMIPTSIYPSNEEIVLQAAAPPPVQMALQGLQLGREVFHAGQQPLGSQEQFNVAADIGLAIAPLLIPALPKAFKGVFPKLGEITRLAPETVEPPLTEAAVKATEPAVPVPEAEIAPVAPISTEPIKPTEEVIPSASEVTSPEGVPSEQVRGVVDEEASLRQQGETPETRQAEVATPQEEVAPTGERVQHGEFAQEGYTATEPAPTVPQPEQPAAPPAAEPAAVAPETPPISDQQHVSTIANRFTQERTASGELGEIAPGQGYSARELAARGLKMPPEEINQHVSDLMQGGGDPVKQGMAVRAEEARLSKQSADLSRAAAANPSNVEARLAADNAFKDVTDFHNGPVARLKANWANQGRGMQGEIPVDLGTFNGLRESWLRDTGKPPPPELEPKLRQTAEKVNNSVMEDNGARQKLGQEIDRVTTRQKLPTPDEVRANIMERMKIEPCRV